MLVRDLIKQLQSERQDLPVVMWDAEADEWVEVEDSIWEDGTSHVALSPTKLDKVAVTEDE